MPVLFIADHLSTKHKSQYYNTNRIAEIQYLLEMASTYQYNWTCTTDNVIYLIPYVVIMSFFLLQQPHEDHFGHVLASHDRESAEDHHFEPVNYRRDIIATKHANRKVHRRRKTRLQTLMRGPSSYSFDSAKIDQPESSMPPLDETDDVPDIPFPVAEAELEIDSKMEELSIPMTEIIKGSQVAPSSPVHYSTEPSDREFQDTTPLSPAASKNSYV